MSKMQVGVLISGLGKNLQALIDYSETHDCSWKIALVISNDPDADGIDRAKASKIHTQIIDHHEFTYRAEFDAQIHKALTTHNIDLVCLAGFTRVLTADMINKWRGKMMKVHQSLLPAFRGTYPVKEALDFGVTITGCTVHFVIPEVDAGYVILQEAVPVLVGDTENTLLERMYIAEHNAFPLAVNMVVEGKVTLNQDGSVTRR